MTPTVFTVLTKASALESRMLPVTCLIITLVVPVSLNLDFRLMRLCAIASLTSSAIAWLITPIPETSSHGKKACTRNSARRRRLRSLSSTVSRMHGSKRSWLGADGSTSVPRSLALFHTCSRSTLKSRSFASLPVEWRSTSRECQPVRLDVSPSNPRRINRLKVSVPPRYLENPVSSNCQCRGSD